MQAVYISDNHQKWDDNGEQQFTIANMVFVHCIDEYDQKGYLGKWDEKANRT